MAAAGYGFALLGFINSSVLTLIQALGCLLQVWLPCRCFRAPTTRSSKISTQIKSQIFSPSKQQLSEWRSPPSICICSIEHFFVTDKETQRIVLFSLLCNHEISSCEHQSSTDHEDAKNLLLLLIIVPSSKYTGWLPDRLFYHKEHFFLTAIFNKN